MLPESRHASATHKHWKLNWWDLWPLADGEQRPIQWTPNSLILSPHPSSPIVLAWTFPSSSHFPFPSPNPILNNPSGYSPPSVIEVSPGDEYVFAFFDGKGDDSVGCIWHREETIDTWKVNIFWHIKPGQGTVLAKWLGEERMWLPTSPPKRAPPLGPSNSFGKITLLLVNQSHIVQVVYRQSPSFSFQLISASLRHTSQANLGDRPVMGESTNGPGGLTVCVRAAIGMGYNDSSIIVATSSTLIAPSSGSIPDFVNAFTVRPSTPPSVIPPQPLWDTFGPEQVVRLCEVKLTAHNFVPGISTAPLPPLFPTVPSSARLTNILMIPHLHPTEAPSSPEGSVVDHSTSNSESIPNTLLHIILSYIDFDNYSSPYSELLSFELQRNKSVPVPSSKFVAWHHRHFATRVFTTSALSFILSARVPGASAMMAGLLDLEGSVARHDINKGKPKETVIGKIVMLKIPELEDDKEWESSMIITSAESANMDPPISATVSPGGSLICTSPPAWSSVSILGVQAHPRHLNPSGTLSSIVPRLNKFQYLSETDIPSIPQLIDSLLATLLLDRSSTDVLHSFMNPSFPLSSVIQVLERTLGILDCDEFSTRDWYGAVLGMTLEVFRGRSRRLCEDNLTETAEKQALEERWNVAMDICSVKALVGAFEACKEDDDAYDLEPVWQLIGLSTWLVEFTERLLRSCVLWEEGFYIRHTEKISEGRHKQGLVETTVRVKTEAMELDGPSIINAELSQDPDSTPFASNVDVQLLHILHPFTLDNLIEALSHLNAFCAYLDTLQASGVKASIAKDILMDVVNCSGVHWEELLKGLDKVGKELQGVDVGVLRRCFCSLTPLPSTHSTLLKACQILTSGNTLSKPRLFVKPADLVDGISRLSLAATKLGQERDIVSKGVLGMPGIARTCARCNGRTETGQTPLPRGKETGDYSRWAVWEHEWERCICRGLWIKDRTR